MFICASNHSCYLSSWTLYFFQTIVVAYEKFAFLDGPVRSGIEFNLFQETFLFFLHLTTYLSRQLSYPHIEELPTSTKTRWAGVAGVYGHALKLLRPVWRGKSIAQAKLAEEKKSEDALQAWLSFRHLGMGQNETTRNRTADFYSYFHLPVLNLGTYF